MARAISNTVAPDDGRRDQPLGTAGAGRPGPRDSQTGQETRAVLHRLEAVAGVGHDEAGSCVRHRAPAIRAWRPQVVATPSVLRASRIIWWVKPHSLSYQAITMTSVVSTTRVRSRSMTAARGSPTMSAETSGSAETPRIP